MGRTRMSRFMLTCVCSVLVLISSATVSAPMAPDPDKEAAFRWLDTNADAMRRVSLNIWNAAELALHEYKSSRELMAYLESNGFRVEKGGCGDANGVRCQLWQRKAGNCYLR
jgi:hypothetical protein